MDYDFCWMVLAESEDDLTDKMNIIKDIFDTIFDYDFEEDDEASELYKVIFVVTKKDDSFISECKEKLKAYDWLYFED